MLQTGFGEKRISHGGGRSWGGETGPGRTCLRVCKRISVAVAGMRLENALPGNLLPKKK